VEVANDSPCLRLPSGPPSNIPAWTDAPTLGAGWDPVLAQFGQLRRSGLSAAMVGMDFFRHRLALLQARLRLAWFYSGNNDECCLACGAKFNHSEEVVASWMNQVMEVKDVAVALLPEEIQALCKDPKHHAVLDGLPATDARGLVPVHMPQGSRRDSGHGRGMQAALSRAGVALTPPLVPRLLLPVRTGFSVRRRARRTCWGS
jgi:hypothetical protein